MVKLKVPAAAADVHIAVFLADEGLGGASAARARAVLEEAHLTRSGKVRLSKVKLARARGQLPWITVAQRGVEAVCLGLVRLCRRAPASA
jgi:hypothetical protein